LRWNPAGQQSHSGEQQPIAIKVVGSVALMLKSILSIVCAPSAIRTLISHVFCATAYDIKP
jgi:hypothetical protein